MTTYAGELPPLSSAQVSSGLDLWLPLKAGAPMTALLLYLEGERAGIREAFSRLHFVHFARFLPSADHKALQVIASFDGDLDAYVLDFVFSIGRQFDGILQYIAGWSTPSAPRYVRDNPAAFLEFVLNHNLGYKKKETDDEKKDRSRVNLYSAYPQRTVIDIIGASGMAMPIKKPNVQAAVVVRSDVQANVLRGVKASLGWHVGLRFDPNGNAHALLNELLHGIAGAPQLSNDADRLDGAPRPPYWLTVGFSFEGLQKLGISAADEAAFQLAHSAFARGAEYRAKANGDIGDSAPSLWELGGPFPVDMVVSIYADSATQITLQSDALLARCTPHGVSQVGSPWKTEVLVDSAAPDQHLVHFGYADGLAQPELAIEGVTPCGTDVQPLASVGEFLLGTGYQNVYGGNNSLDGLSASLAQNATFAALRIMEQDVAGFEALLDNASATHGVDREWLAAKLLGRWRDGTPLSQSPDAPLPEHGVRPKPDVPGRNDFDYLPSLAHPVTADDSAGLRCPVGAHVRRMNPRNAVVAGAPHSRRLLRRGMPYGPMYDHDGGNDPARRGLVGLFLCANLERQFEFILRNWVQGDRATTGITGQQDPIIGAQATELDKERTSGPFRIARPWGIGDIVLDVPRLVKTVGSVYLLMPGLAGFGYLAGLGGAVVVAPAAGSASRAAAPPAASAAPNPATFDPRDMGFRNDPFPALAAFRSSSPVALKTTNSTWAFSHADVTAVTKQPADFRKLPSKDKTATGVLTMDEPHHQACRDAMQVLFNQVLAQVQVEAPFEATVRKCYVQRCQNKGQAQALDWATAFAESVAHAVFFELFGLPVDKARLLITQMEAVLELASPMDNAALTEEINMRRTEFAQTVSGLRKFSKEGRMFDLIHQMPNAFDPKNGPGAIGLQMERAANAATLPLTGIMTLQWFITLATWRLLEDKGDGSGNLLESIKKDPAISNLDVIEELLRFDSPVPMSTRHVGATGAKLGNLQLKEDDRVVVSWSSASRDPAAYGPNPDVIDFKRTNKGPGWAFGGTGPRNCLGQGLVYQVMEPVIQTLRTANPVPRLQEGFTPRWGTPSQSAFFRTMSKLMVHC